MKSLNAQKEIMTLLSKGRRIIYLKHDGKNFISDGFVGYFIEDNDFYLNPDKMEKSDFIERLIDGDFEYAEDTGDLKKRDKTSLLKIANKNNHAWVDTKLIKNFEDPMFEIKTQKNVLLIYERKQTKGAIRVEVKDLVGLVMPVGLDK